MDEEMEIMHELLADEDSFLVHIDSEYEFDACQFFDFTRGETESEADEAESWFRYAREYPPSPFIQKLKMMRAAKAKAKANQMKAHKTSFRKKEADKKTSSSSSVSDGGDIYHEAPSKESKFKGVKHHNHTPQDNSKTKSKSAVNLSKPTGSSFMKPTASHLAKQNKERDTHSGGYGRVQKPLVSPGEKLISPSTCSNSNQATKRQKLEIGYLRKVAQLKHRTTFMHKIVKKVAEIEGNSNSRCKTTIPPKPGLVTEEKAQRSRSHNKSEEVQQPKANTLKPRPLNKKVGTCDNLLLCKQNSTPPMIEEMPIKSQNIGNDNFKSLNNPKAFNSAKVHPIKDGGSMLNARLNSNIELFKKLSLKHASDTKLISSVRNIKMKENVPISFQDFRRCVEKSNQCGNKTRITEVKT